jgi:hypothetical protein
MSNIRLKAEISEDNGATWNLVTVGELAALPALPILDLDENHIYLGGNDGQAHDRPVGGDLTVTDNGGIADFQIAEDAVTGLELADESVNNDIITGNTEFSSIQSADGTEQFTLTNGARNLRFEGTGDAEVSFDAATHKVTINVDGFVLPPSINGLKNEPYLVWDTPSANLTNAKLFTAGEAFSVTPGASEFTYNVLYDDVTIGLNGDNKLYLKDGAVTADKLDDSGEMGDKLVQIINNADSEVIEDYMLPDNVVFIDSAPADGDIEGTYEDGFTIIDGAVTAAKLNSDVAGAGLEKNATTGALDINHDATLAISSDQLGINLANDNVWTGKQEFADIQIDGNLQFDAAGQQVNEIVTTIGASSTDNQLPTAKAILGHFWYVGGNSGTTAGTDFLGTTDSVAMEIKVSNYDGNTLKTINSLILNVNGSIQHDTPPCSDGYVPGIERGNRAVDLQGCRLDSEQVASGGLSTIGGGGANLASGDQSTISGGVFNVALGRLNVIGGGWGDTAIARYSTIAGGNYNTTRGVYSTISGGGHNRTYGHGSIVAGGGWNTAKAKYSTVGGGQHDSAFTNYSTVGGGRYNKAKGDSSYVGGGSFNTAEGTSSVVTGGYENIADGIFSVVGGGYKNKTSDSANTIAGGYENTVSGNFSTIGGGSYNVASGVESIISGGSANVASGWCATVSGGWGDTASATTSTVSGGAYNTASGFYSTVSGGGKNIAKGTVATIGGGSWNNADGGFSTIAGGVKNIVSAKFATVSGGERNVASDEGATIAGGSWNNATKKYSTVSGGTYNTASGVSSVVPGGSYAVADNYGQMAYASGRFADDGDAQVSLFVLRNTTSDSTTTSLFLNGSSENITISSNKAMAFKVLVVGHGTGGAQRASYMITGYIENSGGITTIYGVSTTLIHETDAIYNATAIVSGNSLQIVVKGDMTNNMRWVARVETSELGW